MRNAASLLILSFGLSYYLIERIGLFSIGPVPVLDVLYSGPFLSASLCFLIIVLSSTFRNRNTAKISGWIYVITVILLVTGLWLSFLTRFSGEVVITEGQTFFSGHKDYAPETLYRGKFATMPDIALKLDELVPAVSSDRDHLEGLKGMFSHFTAKSEEQQEIIITGGIPSFLDGVFFRIRDMGYSPRYVLKTDAGKPLDSSFIYMKLFPHGSEDNFRLLSPLTYYVRYYPEGSEDLGDTHIALRIVRNKDIVFNGNITLTEDASFENSRISFDEVRKWTKLSIVHDWGVLPVLSGIILGLISLVIRGIKA